MVRKIAGVALLAAAIHAETALGLGLGDISVRSMLNEPLSADIRVSGAGELSADQILVKLAAREDFERAGVEREYFLSDLQFRIEGSGANAVIKVTTPQPVREPYLDFLVEVKWPSGRLLREYTVLLDIQPYASHTVRTSVAPAARPSAQRRAAPAAAPRAEAAVRPAAGSAAGGVAGSAYEVREGDTLWSIARRVKPSDAVSVRQTVDALHQSNPEAFIGGDPDRLVAGAVLRVPTASQIQSGTPATEPVQAQAAAAAPAEVSPRSESAPAAAGATEAGGEQPGGKLTLAAPGAAAAPAEAAAQGAGAAVPAEGALRAELAASQEVLDKTQRENTELKGKLEGLEKQVQDLERLVSLKDERLAAMQEQASGLQPGGAAADGAVGVAAPAPAEPAPATPVAETAPPAQAPAAGPAVPEAAVVPPAPEQKPERAKPAPVEPVASADNSLLYFGGGAALLILLGGLGYSAMRRRRQEGELPLSALTSGQDAFDTASAEMPAPHAPEPEAAPVAPVPEAPVVVAEEAPARPETTDPVAEADIYIAHGRPDQAVSLLQAALESEPVRSDVRLKLLEIFASIGDREAFEDVHEGLKAGGDAAALRKAAALLATLPVVAAAAVDEGFMEVAPEPSLAQEGLDLERELASLDLEMPELESPGESEFELDLSSLEAEAAQDLGVSLAGGQGEELLDASLSLEEPLTELDLDAELATLADVPPAAGFISAHDEGIGQASEGLGELLDLDVELGGLEQQAGISLPEPQALVLSEEEAPLSLDESLTELDLELGEEQPAAPVVAESDALELGGEGDEVATKLDLARAYSEMGDADGALEILNEVLEEGSAAQQEEARALMAKLR